MSITTRVLAQLPPADQEMVKAALPLRRLPAVLDADAAAVGGGALSRDTLTAVVEREGGVCVSQSDSEWVVQLQAAFVGELCMQVQPAGEGIRVTGARVVLSTETEEAGADDA